MNAITNKSELRQIARSHLGELTPEQTELFDTQIASAFLSVQSFMPHSNIACYMPLKGEVSCRPILQQLSTKGHNICLPAVIARDTPLLFRQYRLGDKLQRGILGPMEPAPTASKVIPDVIIIPMLAFNRAKFRLGYGTGFYDRTLEELRQTKPIKTIGLAYSIQEMHNIPVEGHDIPMDMIITEKEVLI